MKKTRFDISGDCGDIEMPKDDGFSVAAFEFDTGMDLLDMVLSQMAVGRMSIEAVNDEDFTKLSGSTLVRNADKSLWAIDPDGNGITRLNQASNIVEF